MTPVWVQTPFPVIGGEALDGGVVFINCEHGMVLVTQDWYDEVICGVALREQWPALILRLEELGQLPPMEQTHSQFDLEVF